MLGGRWNNALVRFAAAARAHRAPTPALLEARVSFAVGPSLSSRYRPRPNFFGRFESTMYNSSPSPDGRPQHSASMDYPQKATTTFDLQGHSPPVVRQTVSSHR